MGVCCSLIGIRPERYRQCLDLVRPDRPGREYFPLLRQIGTPRAQEELVLLEDRRDPLNLNAIFCALIAEPVLARCLDDT